MKDLVSLLGVALKIFVSRGGRLLSGAVAFYALLSIVPMLVVALRVAEMFTGDRAAQAALLNNLSRWVGADGANTVFGLVWRARLSESGRGVSVFATCVLIYGSTRLFSQMKRALDILWEAPKAPGNVKDKVLATLEKRAISFALVVLLGLTVVIMVVAHALLERLRILDAPFDVSRMFELGLSFSTTFVLFALVYKVLPARQVATKHALVGGWVTALLFCAGSYGVSAYVAHKAGGSLYGAFSALVMLLLWVHYSAHVFFFGASLTIAHAERVESRE